MIISVVGLTSARKVGLQGRHGGSRGTSRNVLERRKASRRESTRFGSFAASDLLLQDILEFLGVVVDGDANGVAEGDLECDLRLPE